MADRAWRRVWFWILAEMFVCSPHGSSSQTAGSARIATHEPFVGSQSQRLELASGPGAVGVENRGLNRWGLHVVAGQPYEGVVWARSERDVALVAAIESGDGEAVRALRALAASVVDREV